MLLAIVIASALEPAGRWFVKHRIPRVIGIVFVYLCTFFLFLTVFYLLIPPLFGDVLAFVSDLPKYIDDILKPDGPLFLLFPTLPAVFSNLMQGVSTSLEILVVNYADNIFKAGSALAGGALSFILLIVISFYLSVQERGIENFLKIVTPLEHEPYILDLWQRSQRKIGLWIQGQMLLGAIVGMIVFICLTLLGIKYAFLLSILTALFEIIPVFGPVMAAIPAIAIGALQSPTFGLLVLGLYILVQQIENHLIYPYVMKKTVGVPPLLVVVSLVVGGKLGGFMGIVLAVPIAAVLVEFMKDLESKKRPKSND